MLDSYYDALGLVRTANTDEVKKAYRKLALKNHPDCGYVITEADKDILKYVQDVTVTELDRNTGTRFDFFFKKQLF